MNPGGLEDVRLSTAQVIARLGVTQRHLRRLVKAGGFPAPHFIRERKKWWLSEVLAWEERYTSTTPPAALGRGAGNLKQAAPGRLS